MRCRNCGHQNPDDASACRSCGSVLPALPPGVPPLPSSPPYIPNYLAFAIISTLLCCMPLGIVAIIYAAQVNGLVQAGEIERARDSSRKALRWSQASAAAILLIFVIYLLITVLGFVSFGRIPR